MTIHSTYQTQARVAKVGKFKKQLTLTDPTFIGLEAIFGSSWLLAAGHVTSIAGPTSIASWVIGGITVLLLGIVYRELDAALPRAGGITCYPVLSHGGLMGYLFEFITSTASSSLISIEIVAAWQYVAAWFPMLTQTGSNDPTLPGWIMQFLLLCSFSGLNCYSVKTFARSDNIINILKFLVSLAVIVALFIFFKSGNLHIQGIAPFGMSGIETTVSAGGIIFAYLGLTPIISVASKVRNPQCIIPMALILSVVLSTTTYVSLQLAFLDSIPTDMLGGGQTEISKQLLLPYRNIAITPGMGWLVFIVVCDAIVSLSDTDNIYMNAAPRVIYGWVKAGTFFKTFTRIGKGSGIPHSALWLIFTLSVFWTLPFPSREQLINVVSAVLVLSYAIAPVMAARLRRDAPDLPRPFRVCAFGVAGPVPFVISALIVFWSGQGTLSWLLGPQVVMFVVYVLCKSKVLVHTVSLVQQMKSSLWLIVFYALITLFSWLNSFGDIGVVGHPQDMVVVAVISLGIYYWGERTYLPQTNFTDDEGE